METRPPGIPAPEPALRSHPCVAVSSAQVLPVYSSSGWLTKKCLLQPAPAGYKYSCPDSPPLAGFEVTTYGRFSGDHRGKEQPITARLDAASSKKLCESTNNHGHRSLLLPRWPGALPSTQTANVILLDTTCLCNTTCLSSKIHLLSDKDLIPFGPFDVRLSL